MVLSFAGFVADEGETGQPYERAGVTVRLRGWAPVVEDDRVIPLRVGEIVELPVWVFSETDHTADTRLRFNYTVAVASFWEEWSAGSDVVSYFIETATGHTIDVTDFVNSQSA